jgi:hypothetical protein
MKNKSIFITAWNRDDLLKKSIYSLTLAEHYDKYKKFIIFQDCNNDQENMIKKIDPEIVVVKKFYPVNTKLYQKMFLNLFSGFTKTFEEHSSDFSIHMEDDIIVSKDIFFFYEYVIKKYSKDRNFFAVNGMSKELVDYNLSLDYSKFIWGICKCWGLHRSRWPALKNLWLKYYEKEKNINHPYDGPVEEYIKASTKYVIMPYRSLILEQLSNGCNSIDDPNYPGYKEWFLSFNSKKKKGDYNYNKKMPYHWRHDCIKYNLKNIVLCKVYNFLKKHLPITLKNLLGKVKKFYLYFIY